MMLQKPLQAAICKGFSVSGCIMLTHTSPPKKLYYCLYLNFQEWRYKQMKQKLVDSKAKNACPKADGRPQNLTDGGGLFLHVSTVGKYWRYNYRFQEKSKTLAIGVYPDISLKQARERHTEARELLARGIDPSSHKKAQKNQSGLGFQYQQTTDESRASSRLFCIHDRGVFGSFFVRGDIL
jgi:hypothetical protein